jgi:hypothetical protein
VGAVVNVDGDNHPTPYSWTSIVGGAHTLIAPSSLATGGGSLPFSGWADGPTDRQRTFTTGGPTTFTAKYSAPALSLAVFSGASTGPVDKRGPKLTLRSPVRGARHGWLEGAVGDPSGVRRVEVALRARQVSRTGCRWWSLKARRLRRASACSAPAWIRARLSPLGTRNVWRWHVSLAAPLPRGGYVLFVRGEDRAGNVTRAVAGHSSTSLRL